MLRTTRSRAAHGAPLIVAAILLVACQPAAVASPSASPVAVTSAVPSTAPVATAAATPTPAATQNQPATQKPFPSLMPRPAIPTDGACEGGFTCLGLLKAGHYHSAVFHPGFAFTMPSAGWENLSQEGGAYALLSTEHAGDALVFFRDPEATKPDGTLAQVDISVDAITKWLTTNTELKVGPATKVTVGGLSGARMDVEVAPTATTHPSDCLVTACVPMFVGRDHSSKPTWQWDWSAVSSERARLYLLTAKDGVVAIFVDSVDGTTFDGMTKAADTILPTVKFDK